MFSLYNYVPLLCPGCRIPPSVPKISQGFERLFYFLLTDSAAELRRASKKIKKPPNTEEIFRPPAKRPQGAKLQTTAERSVREADMKQV